MVGAAPAVKDVLRRAGHTSTPRCPGRPSAIPPILQQLAAQGQLAPTVVVQVGINGTVTEENLRDMADAVEGRRLLILNARVPRSWEEGNNALVKRFVPELPNADYIDWYKASNGHRDWFLDDGVHLTRRAAPPTPT